MKTRYIAIIAAIFGLALGCSNPVQNPTITGGATADITKPENQLIVKVADGADLTSVDALVGGTRLETIASFGGYSYVLYGLSGEEKAQYVIARLEASGRVVSAEQNQVYKAFLVPNDPQYAGYQYAPQNTDLETGWNVTTGASSVVVAVLDTGINGAHEDFGPGKVIAGYNYVSGSAISAGANSDNNGHGTHVAGIIGAVGNNSLGIAGVAWQTLLMPVKVLDISGSGTTSGISSGIVWAADNGATIMNMSLGGTGYSPMMADAVNYALTAGVTVVVAMGNDGMSLIEYPAGYGGVIAVGSTNGRNQISGYSTTGTHCSVSAPGENIYSLSYSSNTGYVYMSGTSMASPFVAGLAALMKANTPGLTPAQIKSMLEDSATDLGPAGFDPGYGYGKVNASSALAIASRDNYGTVKAQVTNNATPLSGAEILLLSGDGSQVLRTGLTSSGNTGGIVGEMDFTFTHGGNYKISAHYGTTTQTQDVTVTGGGVQTKVFNFSIPSYALTVQAAAGGSVSPSGTISVLSGSPTSILATPNTYNSFLNWTTVTGTGVSFGNSILASTTVTLTAGNATIQANFWIPNHIIETFPNGGGDFTDTYMILYDSALNQITYDDDDGTALYSLIPCDLTSGQTYYILVQGFSSTTTGYYSILVNASGGGSSTVTPNQSEGELDNDSASARQISVDTVYDRYLTAGDLDWFKVTIP